MNNATFCAALAARLVDCAAARTAREFSQAADRLDNLVTTTPAQRREVRAAGRRALDAYLARAAHR